MARKVNNDDAARLKRALASLLRIKPGIQHQAVVEANAGRELSPEETKYLTKARFRDVEDYLK